MTKYRIVKQFEGEVAWQSRLLSDTDATAELKTCRVDHERMIARELASDPRGETSPVVQRLRKWEVKKVEITR